MHCTITGAGGFIGRHLAAPLVGRGHTAATWGRNSGLDLAGPARADDRAWVERLRGTDAVIHLAGRAHVQGGDPAREAELHHRINFEGTARLARAARAAGVRRFIFVSTAKVFGEGEDGPYAADSPPNPQDAYARSKWQAEVALREIAGGSAMDVTIVRPPLVYGPGVGANFARLVRLARLPLPLPLAAVANRRDLIAIGNLVDLLVLCVDHPAAAGAVLPCSDGHPYSLAELVAQIRTASGLPRRLFALPPRWLEAAARAALGSEGARRLFGDFELDIRTTRARLGWSPPCAMPATLGWLAGPGA